MTQMSTKKEYSHQSQRSERAPRLSDSGTFAATLKRFH